MTALAPCPFCGAPAELARDEGEAAYMSCIECGATSKAFGGGAGKTDAIAAWNRRAPALRWRTAPPDVPGWWWYGYRDDSRPSIAYYSARECRRVQASLLSRTHWRWAGPLPEPEEGE